MQDQPSENQQETFSISHFFPAWTRSNLFRPLATSSRLLDNRVLTHHSGVPVEKQFYLCDTCPQMGIMERTVHLTSRTGRPKMFSPIKAVGEFLKQEDGPTAVEYAVLLALIILVVYGAVATLGSNTNGTFANPTLQSATSSS